MGPDGKKYSPNRNGAFQYFMDACSNGRYNTYISIIASFGIFRESADEVMQQVAYDLCRQSLTEGQIQNLDVYVRKAIENQCKYSLRKNIRLRILNQVATYAWRQTDTRSPFASAVREEHHRLLVRAYKGLIAEHREVITLHYKQNLSISNMAKLLNIPEGTVKSRLNRALSCLKQFFDRDEYNIYDFV